MIKQLFGKISQLGAKPQSSPLRQRPAVIGGLSDDLGVDGLLSWFERYQYVDDVLAKAGLGVNDLGKLLDDDEIAGCWEKRTLAVEQRPWGLSEPESELSKFVYDALMPHWAGLVSELMQSVIYGSSCPQITYKQDGGKWMISHYISTPATSLLFDKGGSAYVRINGVERKINDYDELRLKLFPVVRRRTAQRPAGTAILSSLWWVALLRTNTWQYWARFLERFGSPLLVGKAAQGMTMDGRTSVDAMAAALHHAVNAGVVTVATDEDVMAIGSAGNGETFRAADAAINARIQRRILGQTLTSDAGGVGSQALGNVHNQIRMEIIAADVALVLPVMQKIINALVEINYPSQNPPTLNIETGTLLSKDRADRDLVLTQTGVKFTRDYYIRAYDFEDGDIVPDLQNTAQNQQLGGCAGLVNLSGDSVDGGQQQLDGLINDAIAQAGDPADYGELKTIVLSAKSPDDLIDKLLAWHDETNSDVVFSDALAALLFAADINGYESADAGLQQ